MVRIRLRRTSTMISLYNNDVFFFFQAEDGIRDYKVTGVQTCALPILHSAAVGRQEDRGPFERNPTARSESGDRERAEAARVALRHFDGVHVVPGAGAERPGAADAIAAAGARGAGRRRRRPAITRSSQARRFALH